MATTNPTITSLTSINPTHAPGLTTALASATSAFAGATQDGDLYQYSKSIAAASNSLAVISAQAVMATASGADKSSASDEIMAAATELVKIAYEDNMYRADLNMGANVFFCVVFGLLMIFHFSVAGYFRYWYYFVVLGVGSGLDFGGYLARCISATDETLVDPFLVQIIVLTIAPAFIMAGIYYMLGRQLVYIGSGYSWLKPRWFSYIYISCDVISLVIQAIGGGMAATALTANKDTDDGTHIMVAGIAFQVATMSSFLIVGGNFVARSWFRASPEVKFSLGNLFALAFHTPRGKELQKKLEPNYDPKYAHVRSRKLFPFIFTAIFAGTVLIYIRCIYRLVELSEGWTGYTIRHEAFLFCLDALMVFLTCTIFVPFHPGFIWGHYHPTLSFRNKKQPESHDFDDNEKLYGDSNSNSQYQNPSEGSAGDAEKLHRGDGSLKSGERTPEHTTTQYDIPHDEDEVPYHARTQDAFADAEEYTQQQRDPYALPLESPERIAKPQDFTAPRDGTQAL
ncbi:hypothetical protein FT663_00661 [Candidozyma haemuli var. vulneris]|uniref:Sphingoid long-chain base transporter RSB1 n=1 Tax=Candidozyma haemuli TaxID=45357 RepID=A0A2V1AP98_9ASCO|nr:hypothetical protein CXQ85_003442 [[Candida] haemuloni]KAF3990792.1 hypothetical protein FT662_02056 [[Candida] haemuloni var. vulneris]KAF3995283.1 hypothetical protein FT663_00661 [[Candida] haemuloni var. vulneris]PVH19595.1 hypothetical protein CXQ85_003442 [[Candida] haemuloni]